jgi:putative oxidoreductase
MKKFFSTQYSDTAFNLATLALRLTFGILLIIIHGLDKINHFSNLQHTFYDFMHIGPQLTLALSIFAEVFCAGLVVLGLFTRFASLVLVIQFSIIVFIVLKGRSLADHQAALFYLVPFFSVLLVGPGRISVDAVRGK